MPFANKVDIDLTNFVQKVSDDPQEVSAEISYVNAVDKPTDPATKEYVDSKFALVNHNHDNRYYTENESDGRYAPIVHNHNDLYFTETESDARYAPISHNHDDRYYTENESDTRFAAIVHNHDDRYYTENESDTRFAQAVHNHDDRYYTENESDSRFAPIVHNHDDRYYTETESDARYALATHNHDDRYYTESETDTFLNGKMSNVVTQLGATGTSLHSTNNQTLSLKRLKQGAGITVSENNGEISIINASPHVNQIDDTQVTSVSSFSSQKTEADYFKLSNVFGSTRSSNLEVYNSVYVNSLESTLTSAINGKAPLSHTHNISEINNLTSTLNGKISTSVTTLGSSGTVLHTINGQVLGLKTLANASGIGLSENNGVIQISNTSPHVNQIDDTQVTSVSSFSSQKTEADYFKLSNVFGSTRTGVDEVYSSVYINSLESTLTSAINGKISTSVTTLGNSGTTLHTINGATLGLKTLTNGSGIGVTENNGVIQISNTSPHVNQIDDTQVTSVSSFSSQKTEADYFKKSNVFGTTRTGVDEVYNTVFINSISASLNNYFLKADLHNTARTSAATEAYSVGYINNLVPTSATADQFITTTTTAGTHQLSTKLSLNPCRFGDQTPTTIHSDSTLFGYSAGGGTSSANRITAFGYKSGEGGNVGTATTFFGYRAGDGSSGVRNVGVGYLAFNGCTGNDNFALGEGSMDGGTNSSCIGIGRYAFRGSTCTNSIGLGLNTFGSGYGFHLHATNSPQRSGANKFVVGHNTNTNFWTTANQYTGSPYLLDGTMGGYDSVREMRINANDIYFGEALPTSNSTAKKIWNDQGVLRYGSGSALAYTDTDNYITGFGLANGLLTGTMTGGASNATGQILPSDSAGYLYNNGSGTLSYATPATGTTLPSQTGQQGKVLSTDGTNPLWTDKIGSSTSHTLFYWAGGVPNHYLLNQATSTTTTGSDLAANGSFENYASSFTIPSYGYAAIINPSTSGTASDTTTLTGWAVEKPANHEYNNCYVVNNSNTVFSSQSQSGSHFVAFRGVTLRQTRNLTSGKNYKLSWYEKTRSNHSATDLTIKVNNVVESATHTLTSSWVLNTCTFTASQTSCDIDFIAKEINSTSDLNTALLDNVTLFELSGGTSELGNIAFGTTGGTFYSSLSGKIRNSTSGQLRGYIQINTQHGDSSPNLDEEMLRIGESTHDQDDAGEFFGTLKVAGVKFAGNTVQTLPVIAPSAGEVGRFLSATSTGAWGWSDKIGSSTVHTWFHWSGGVANQYLLNQGSSPNDSLGQLIFGTTGGSFYGSICGKVRDSTSGQLRGYIQINTQHGDSSPNLDEETLRIGESSHSTSDAGEFFGDLKVSGLKFSNNIVQTLPVVAPSAGEVGRFLSATGTGAWGWNDKIGSSVAHNWFYWSGGIINQYLLSQPSSAGDQCGVIAFGHTNGTMFSAVYGKVRDTTAGQLRGYIQIDTQNNNGTDVLNEETLRIGESSHSVDDAGEFFGDLKVSGLKFSNNVVQTLPVVAPSAGEVGRFLSATSTGAWGWNDKIGSSTAYNWFYWSGGIMNQYLLSQPSSAGDQCGVIFFGHTNGAMYGAIYGKVRDTTVGQLRGYIQIDTQNNNGTDVLTEETLRIGESSHTTADAGEFFGNLKLSGVRFSNNAVQSAPVTAPTSADAAASRILTATGTGTWAWSDPPSGGSSTLLTLSDVGETSYSSQNHRVLIVNSTGSGMEFGGVFGCDDSNKKINIGDGNVSDMQSNSVAIGHEAGAMHSSRSRNDSVFIGVQAAVNTSAPESGKEALQMDNAVVIGYRAAYASDFLENSVVIGSQAGFSASMRQHANSVIIGGFAAWNAGTDSTSGNTYSSVHIGTYCGRNVRGLQNVSIGRDCLYHYQKESSDNTSNNLCMGNICMRNTKGNANACVGTSCLRYDGSGRGQADYNLAIGYEAMCTFQPTVQRNIALGYKTMLQANGCESNIGIGFQAMRYCSGDLNINIGKEGFTNQTGSNNIIIGNLLKQSAGSTSDELMIGNNNTSAPLLHGSMKSTSAASSLSINAATINLDHTNLPTSYDSNYPSRVWLDGSSLQVSPSTYFFASVSGRDTSSFSNSFTTYVFPTVDSDVYSRYNSSTGIISLPFDGLYQITGTMRSLDGSTVGRQWGVGVHTSSVDGAHFLWHAVQNTTNSYDRTTYPYIRVARFNALDQLRMFVYVDGGAISMAMGGMQVYKLSD